MVISRASVGSATAVALPVYSGIGAVFGYHFLPASPILGLALGGTLGAVLSLDANREYTGRVEVAVDGSRVVQRFFGDPNHYRKSPSELRHKLFATGVLGDWIAPFSAVDDPEVDSPHLKSWSGAREPLKELAASRRLVADLGQNSRYGEPVLNRIGAEAVRPLVARGIPIYAVVGQESVDTVHQVNTEAVNGVGTRMAVRAFEYVSREFPYELHPLSCADDLRGLPEGQGVPEGMTGVYRDQSSYTQPIYRSHQDGERRLSKHTDEQSMAWEEVLRADTPQKSKPGPVASRLRSMVDPSTRGYAIFGGVLGMAAGMAIPGMEPIGGIVLGAAAGHFAGRAAVARSYKPVTGSSMLHKVLIGAGSAGGAAVGLLAGLQTGEPAVIAGVVTGMVGGLCAGALVGRAKREAAGTLGVAGLTAGAYLGLFAGATASPLAGLALSALGAVAGGSTAYMAMAPKR